MPDRPSPSPAARARAALARTDDRVFRRVAITDHGPLDGVLRLASRATDYSMLWIGVAGALAGVGGTRGRRAAARGWTAIAVHSLLLNQPLKRLVARERPDLDLVPVERHPTTTTTTHAFPSGHTGSAVAFTVGAVSEVPGLAGPLAVVAALVGYSRVHAGMHHPSNVVAGVATGALAGRAAVTLWRRRETAPG